MTVILINLFIQMLAGSLGGNMVQFLTKNLDLGLYVNSLIGLVGGGVGAHMAMAIFPKLISTAGFETVSILAQSVSGFVGGGVFVALLALIRRATAQ